MNYALRSLHTSSKDWYHAHSIYKKQGSSAHYTCANSY